MTLEEAILKSDRPKKEQIVISTVLSHLQLTILDVKSKSRKTNVVYARHLIHWICWKETPLSLRQIGNVLGLGMDHATVINSTKRISGWIERNSTIRANVQMIYDSCLAAIAIDHFEDQINTNAQINKIVETIQVAMSEFPYNNCASF